jgi:1,4-dihydroxy-2-naphthoyl-CoA hydrolase
MPRPVTPERYDADAASAMTQLGDGLEGLPAYLAIRTTHIGPATMTAELDVRADLLNPFGTLHGGVISALVDHVLGTVLYPVIERGRWAATTEFKVNLLAAVRAGSLEARSTIVSLTRRTAVVQVEVDNDGRPCALAQGTVLIAEPRATT